MEQVIECKIPVTYLTYIYPMTRAVLELLPEGPPDSNLDPEFLSGICL